MSQFFQIHPDNPQARLVRQAVDIIRQGGVVVYPTDSAYALGCQIDFKNFLSGLPVQYPLFDTRSTQFFKDLVIKFASPFKYDLFPRVGSDDHRASGFSGNSLIKMYALASWVDPLPDQDLNTPGRVNYAFNIPHLI